MHRIVIGEAKKIAGWLRPNRFGKKIMHDLNRALHQKRSEYENTQHKAIFLDKLAKEMMKQINLESQSGNNYRMRWPSSTLIFTKIWKKWLVDQAQITIDVFWRGRFFSTNCLIDGKNVLIAVAITLKMNFFTILSR